MALRKTSHSTHGTLNELNITPLLDLVFVLLVIFIITTPQLMNNLEMVLPSAKPPPQRPDAPKPAINRIVIQADGTVLLDDRPVSVEILRTSLATLQRTNANLGVVVKSSDDVFYQKVVDVLDVLQQLDITRVGLATDAAAGTAPTP